MPRHAFRLVTAAAVLAACASVAPLDAIAQRDTEPVEGIKENTPRVHALTGARVFVSPSRVLESATIVLRDGLVEAVGPDVAVPDDARVWNLEGRIVYPGFIDPMSKLGLPASLKPREPPAPSAEPGRTQPAPLPAPPRSATGFWNPMIRPETDVAALIDLDEDDVEALRSVGITAALAVPRRGILRGESALVSLADPGRARRSVLAAGVAQHAGIELVQGNSPPAAQGQSSEYPSSLMGAIALMRQAFYDAQWYRDMNAYYAANPDIERAATDSALAALEPVVARDEPLIYATDDELDYARALRVADEFGLDIVLYGNGHEYRKTDQLAALAHPLIIPLEFPKAPSVDAPDGALAVSLETLQHWELAPSNAAFLAQAGIPFAFTADGLDDVKKELWTNVRLAVHRGLPPAEALAALTTVPADIVGFADSLGTIEGGKIADLVVADGDLFTDDESKIELVFVDGAPYELEVYEAIDPEGQWDVSSASYAARWSIRAEGDRLTLAVGEDEFRGRIEGEQVILLPEARIFGAGGGLARLTGFVHDGTIEGLGALPDGGTFAWRASFAGALDEAGDGDASVAEDASERNGASDADEDAVPSLEPRPYPAGAFGLAGPPAAPPAILVRGATLWTSAEAGRIDNGDLIVRDGRITEIGRDLEAPRGALVIDAAGKHVTAGLIDAHSHTAISRGINETGSAVTLEVRIADVLNPTDIGIYRELAGGLTVANVMHGSANPMGGQTQTIKLRWGGDAAGLIFEGAAPGIKFALGENVKQSNWGDRYTTRYPQTRMGVDEIIRDTLNAAVAYGEERASQGRRGPPVRRNLRLDTALEILSGERRIHVHSYRQDEILAFVRLVEDYGLDVAAFQHVLEGYKVAPEIASIGAGGSTFSDWWGYKFEVWDAIPYNGALMHRAGVVVSFNSDDDELATRLNTEAAKAVKYGGLSEEEALDFVTINPAVQLGIDARVGSLEPGKDADFVIWSGNPLSAFSRAEQVWIDGRRYFDLATDAAMRTAAVAERERLIQRVLEENTGGDSEEKRGEGRGSGRPPTDVYSSAYHASDAKEGAP